MKICIQCKHHKRTHYVACWHPKLKKAAGINVTMLREMGNQFQKATMSKHEICGREGRWYERLRSTRKD